MNKFFEEGMDPSQIGVKISEMLVATVEASDSAIDHAVSSVLRILRNQLKMDVVFVSEFVNGQRVFRKVDGGPGAPAPGDSDPLETTYCQRIVDGRLPKVIPDINALPVGADVPSSAFKVGSLISTPIELEDGSVYGTLCCYSAQPSTDLGLSDLNNLRLAAQLAARNIHPGNAAATRA